MAERQLLTPQRLKELLTELDQVMGEAARLRRQITRQLDEHQRSVQQNVTPSRKRAAKPR